MERRPLYRLAVLSGIMFVLITACAQNSSMGRFPALPAPTDSPGRSANTMGIHHYRDSHWGEALDHFDKAIRLDPELAEAHYNAALCLDQMRLHEEATDSFRKARELAPDNQTIVNSEILKNHLGMK